MAKETLTFDTVREIALSDLRATLLKSKPEIYYITDHYAPYPWVLVRLARIGRKELRELLAMAWSFTSAKKPARKPHT